MKLGIVGLPNVGKSTLFNAITNAGVPVGQLSRSAPSTPMWALCPCRTERLDVARQAPYDPRQIHPCHHRVCGYCRLWSKAPPKARGSATSFCPHIRDQWTLSFMWSAAFERHRDHPRRRRNRTRPRDIETINLELIFSDHGRAGPPDRQSAESGQSR